MKLRAENIKKSYKGRQVVKGVSVEVNQGEIVGLLGPNGAGKTTSFYMIVGLVRPNEGKVFLDDLEITRHAMYKRAQLGVGYLPQEVSVFRKMSVEDNIMTVLEMTELNKEERKEKLESLLSEFGLTHVRKNLGQSLSGGEKRRTEIARALATNPKFILLDEPFAGVDPIAVEDIQKIVYKLKKRNIGVLITDHNVQETLSITDRTYLLFEGSILREGTAESLAADEMVRKVYLGEKFVLRKNNDFLEDTENEDKENELVEGEKTGANYVANVANFAEETLKNINGYGNRGQAGANVMELKSKIEDLKEYFKAKDLPSNCGEMVSKLSYKSFNHYKFGLMSVGLEVAMIFVPILGWIVFFIMRGRLKECKTDTQNALSILRSLSNELLFKGL